MMPGMPSTPVSILVIEHHPLMRESLCAAINEEPDLRVEESASGNPRAFRQEVSDQYDVFFLAHKPDIILFALGNPGLEDLQALADLCKALPGTPILALIRDDVPGQAQTARQHGARTVISKCAERKEMLQALRGIYANSTIPLQFAK
jgi:DNA-binding NarL/FixJ family response regulator